MRCVNHCRKYYVMWVLQMFIYKTISSVKTENLIHVVHEFYKIID